MGRMVFVFWICMAYGLGVNAQPSAVVTISIEGVSSASGKIMMALFKQADGFPFTHQKAYKLKQINATPGTHTVRFTDLEPGTYAFAVYHDENGDSKLNTNAFGVPKEGYGFSNNVRPKFSAPDFEDAAFTLKGTQQMRVTIQY